MDMIRYHKSIVDEMNAIKQRIRQLMNEPHWLTDGEWKESILRHILRRHLPERFRVGRGYVITQDRCSTQIDILIYDSASALIFKEGDLVFATPDAVHGIMEVKSKTTKHTLSEALDKLIPNCEMIYARRMPGLRHVTHHDFFSGIFSYETEIDNPNIALEMLQEKSNGHPHRIVSHVCLDESLFFKFWDAHVWDNKNPEWHSYRLERLAPAYFVGNLIDTLAPNSVFSNPKLWFPLDSKEVHKTGSRPLHPHT